MSKQQVVEKQEQKVEKDIVALYTAACQSRKVKTHDGYKMKDVEQVMRGIIQELTTKGNIHDCPVSAMRKLVELEIGHKVRYQYIRQIAQKKFRLQNAVITWG